MDLGTRMASLARSLESEDGRSRTLDLVVLAARDLVDSCTDAGLSLLQRHETIQVDTAAATGETPRLGDAWQYQLGEGPCLDAIWEQPLVHSYDLREERRWPQWAPKVCVELGIRSMLSVRLFTNSTALGALNLYSERPGGFAHDEREEALAVAAHAAIAMSALDEVDQLHQGLARRTVIGQATGVIMERYGVSAEAAFEVLRRLSQDQNRKLHQIAEELVRSGATSGLVNGSADHA